MTTTDSFALEVSNDSFPIDWKVRTVGDWYDLENNTSNPVWVTWGEPNFVSPGVTARRVYWVTWKAHGCASIGDSADAIWDALADHDPPLDSTSGQNAGWALLDGQVYGDCYGQADLMERALFMLGISSEVKVVRASDKNGQTPYDCEDFEHHQCTADYGKTEWLVLCFGAVAPGNISVFEGCCKVAGNWYAVWEKEKASDAYHMLIALGDQHDVTQWWCWYDEVNTAWVFCSQETEPVPMP
jgi:hypothetical protein